MDKKAPTIIKHENPIPIDDDGDILKPFNSHDTHTGCHWYSKPTEHIVKEMPLIPLIAFSQNPWKSLDALGINCAAFKDMVSYVCPFTDYKHYWFVPLFLFSENIEEWIDKAKAPFSAKYKNQDLVKHNYPYDEQKGFTFTKIQRSLLGAGYTESTYPSDGFGRLCDAVVCLSTGDFLGGKVWVWFNR